MNSSSIWKYELNTDNEQFVYMPPGAKILTVQIQGTKLCLWAKVNPNDLPVPRKILIRATGEDASDVGDYLGTLHVCGGEIVFHIFTDEVTK